MPKQSKTIKLYEHNDRLGQPIQVGDHITFSHSYTTGTLLGRVEKLTKLRVRIAYNITYTHQGKEYKYAGHHLATPENTIVITNRTPEYITLYELKQ